MSDEADAAQQQEEAFRAEAIRRARRRLQAAPEVPAARYCENCGMPIPKARREAVPSTKRCVNCQSDLERRVA